MPVEIGEDLARNVLVGVFNAAVDFRNLTPKELDEILVRYHDLKKGVFENEFEYYDFVYRKYLNKRAKMFEIKSELNIK